MMNPSARKLTPVEAEILEQLRSQVHAYQTGTQGSAGAVARWLRILADKLEECGP